MKTLILFLAFSLCVKQAFAQEKFDTTVSKLLSFIERNLSAEKAVNSDTSTVFFIYDLSLDSAGNIYSIHPLIMDNLPFLPRIHRLSAMIKTGFHFPSSKYRKIFIPVMVMRKKNDEMVSKEEKANLETADIMEELSHQKFHNYYFTRLAAILQLE